MISHTIGSFFEHNFLLSARGPSIQNPHFFLERVCISDHTHRESRERERLERWQVNRYENHKFAKKITVGAPNLPWNPSRKKKNSVSHMKGVTHAFHIVKRLGLVSRNVQNECSPKGIYYIHIISATPRFRALQIGEDNSNVKCAQPPKSHAKLSRIRK